MEVASAIHFRKVSFTKRSNGGELRSNMEEQEDATEQNPEDLDLGLRDWTCARPAPTTHLSLQGNFPHTNSSMPYTSHLPASSRIPVGTQPSQDRLPLNTDQPAYNIRSLGRHPLALL